MGGTGQTDVLADGISRVLGKAYAILSPVVGLIGTFMTASNMSSNILFGAFQSTTASILHLHEAAVLGACLLYTSIMNILWMRLHVLRLAW